MKSWIISGKQSDVVGHKSGICGALPSQLQQIPLTSILSPKGRGRGLKNMRFCETNRIAMLVNRIATCTETVGCAHGRETSNPVRLAKPNPNREIADAPTLL
jgi:hypothetical protein